MTSEGLQIRAYPSLRFTLQRGLDLCCLLLGLTVAGLYGQPLSAEQFLVILSAGTLLFLAISPLTANYRAWRGAALRAEIAIVWLTWAAALTSLVLLNACIPYGSGLTRGSFGLWAIATGLLLAAARWTVRTIRRLLWARGINTRGFAVVGITPIGVQLARNIVDSPDLGLRFLGFYDDRPQDRTAELPADLGSCLGNIEELVRRSRAGEIGTIYITFPMRAEERIRSVLHALADSTASVYVVPDFFVFELLHSRWSDIQGIPVVSIFENPFFGADGLLKRLVDLTLGTLLLIGCAIPMALIAVLIKVSSSGPVFYRQKRYGLDGREIWVWKFRTMRVGEEHRQVIQAKKGDPRVTPVGAILRRSSLDELPQLFNVLRGNMSLVGPRPHASLHNEHFRSQIHGYMLRHKVKPGITGLAQVEGFRGETDTLDKMQGRVEWDHRYIRNWNLWLDFKIMLRTVLVVFSGKNAY